MGRQSNSPPPKAAQLQLTQSSRFCEWPVRAGGGYERFRSSIYYRDLRAKAAYTYQSGYRLISHITQPATNTPPTNMAKQYSP